MPMTRRVALLVTLPKRSPEILFVLRALREDLRTANKRYACCDGSRPYCYQYVESSCSFLAEFRSEKGLDCLIVLLHHELLAERFGFLW